MLRAKNTGQALSAGGMRANQFAVRSVNGSQQFTLATLTDAAHTPCGGAQAKQNTTKTRAISSVG